MYLRHVKVQNWRMLNEVSWDLGFPREGGNWHVILGPNGSGKSTLLRAISLALLGPQVGERMEPKIREFISRGEEEAIVSLRSIGSPEYDRKRGQKPDENLDVSLGLRIRDIRGSRELAKAPRSDRDVGRTLWEEDLQLGWYSSAIGSNRRFRGNEASLTRYFEGQAKLLRHITLFYEEISFGVALNWIAGLEDGMSSSYNPDLLKRIVQTLNSPGLLPFGVKALRLGKENVFQAPDGESVGLEAMSEGFKSLFAIIFEVLRGLAEVYGPERLYLSAESTISAPGVVLVDEIDLHLHPEWQREIGSALTQAFPHIQWIVTTHSPFVTQHAIEGTILRLPAPDDDEVSFELKGEEYLKAVYGDITDSLDSLAFSVGQTRSDEAQRLLGELAGLNVKQRRDNLSVEEVVRRRHLLKLFPEVERRTLGTS